MGKRGRPAGVNSSETRKRILDAARSVFSTKGYDGASILKIAELADLVPSAIYHHFENKETLYMAVFEDTADAIWGSVSSATEEKTLVEAFSHLIESSRKIADNFPGHSAFLGAMPHEARFHPDYEKLMNFSRKIAIALKKSVNCKRIGLSVVGLEVPHVHVHLIPLDSMSDMNFSRSVKLNDSEFKSIVKKIKSNLK